MKLNDDAIDVWAKWLQERIDQRIADEVYAIVTSSLASPCKATGYAPDFFTSEHMGRAHMRTIISAAMERFMADCLREAALRV